LRRHHRARLKIKRLDYYGGYMRTLSAQQCARHLGRAVQNAALCSCWACGNPRRYFGELTLPERRFALREQVDWAEYIAMRHFSEKQCPH
jgi:hypothetical protein